MLIALVIAPAQLDVAERLPALLAPAFDGLDGDRLFFDRDRKRFVGWIIPKVEDPLYHGPSVRPGPGWNQSGDYIRWGEPGGVAVASACHMRARSCPHFLYGYPKSEEYWELAVDRRGRYLDEGRFRERGKSSEEAHQAAEKQQDIDDNPVKPGCFDELYGVATQAVTSKAATDQVESEDAR